MAVKVGINASAALAAMFCAPRLASEIDLLRQRLDQPRDAGPPAQVRLDSGQLEERSRCGADFIHRRQENQVFSERDPAKLDWASVGAQVVVESTGFLPTRRRRRLTWARPSRRSSSQLRKNEDLTIVLVSTKTSTTPPSTTSSPTPVAPPTAWRRSSR